MEGYEMVLVDGLIVLAIIFFLVLPITDEKTVRMKLSVLSGLGVLLAVLVVVPHLPHRRSRWSGQRATAGVCGERRLACARTGGAR
jgi:4-amino-4-deoxy-L-arabinose transferase-like glycosyltransferase